MIYPKKSQESNEKVSISNKRKNFYIYFENNFDNNKDLKFGRFKIRCLKDKKKLPNQKSRGKNSRTRSKKNFLQKILKKGLKL